MNSVYISTENYFQMNCVDIEPTKVLECLLSQKKVLGACMTLC